VRPGPVRGTGSSASAATPAPAPAASGRGRPVPATLCAGTVCRAPKELLLPELLLLLR